MQPVGMPARLPYNPIQARVPGVSSYTRHSHNRLSRILAVHNAGPSRAGSEQTDRPVTATMPLLTNVIDANSFR